MSKQNEILEKLYTSVIGHLSKTFIKSEELLNKIEFVCRCNSNKAPIRFLMSCLLAKIDKPNIDIRKPYTEIRGEGTYSGRYYDENYIEEFVHKYKLPCNPTTAYLTPAFRNLDRVLTLDLVLVGRPRKVYEFTLEILNVVHSRQESSEDVLSEILRFLLIIKAENDMRMEQLIAELALTNDVLPLSSDETVTLLTQHLSCRNSSRLPVLIVAAAYEAVKDKIGEITLPLQTHNAADSQTGATGDVEIVLVNEKKIVTSYEMKDRRVTKNDIDRALQKIAVYETKIDNYIFITTELIDLEITDYAKSLYEKTGIEIAVLDCIGFTRHYLHFFHRRRTEFLNIYQRLVLIEPTSSVSQALKEAFLALRRVAETNR